MIAIDSALLLGVFLLLCRVGSCLMLMPGLASPRVPIQVRLYVAMGATVALAPVLLPQAQQAIAERVQNTLGLAILIEIGRGLLIGVLGRAAFSALQFMSTALSNFMGFGGVHDLAIEDFEPNAAVGNLITLAATLLFFISDLHWQVLHGIVQSYFTFKVTDSVGVDELAALPIIAGQAFTLALQISSPFFVYAISMNLAFGIVNKLTPQIPVYFVSLPFVIAGGLFLLYFAVGELLGLFIGGLSTLMNG